MIDLSLFKSDKCDCCNAFFKKIGTDKYCNISIIERDNFYYIHVMREFHKIVIKTSCFFQKIVFFDMKISTYTNLNLDSNINYQSIRELIKAAKSSYENYLILQ